ncbi:MAG TPA: serine hydrolase domain-containing protein [Candidatus Limnocylindria bacterium]
MAVRDSAPPGTLGRELDQVIADASSRFNVPGIAVALISGEDHLTAAVGVTSVENPLPVDADTLFRIASITKPITGTALMKLVELGRLDFDAPIRSYLPDLRLADEDVAAHVTMRHIVTHRVGLSSRMKNFGGGDDALAKWTAHLSDLPQRARLGELFCYSWDFQLTGRVIEVLTGKTYEDAIRELVLVPLGMTRSCFFARDAITYRVAAGHDVKDGRPQVARPWMEVRNGHPSGGMLSTASDLMRFMRLHLGQLSAGGERLLSEESIAFMASALTSEGAHGVTWWRFTVNGLLVIEHAGGYPGFLAELVLVPARQFGIAVLTNITRTGYQHRVPEIGVVSGDIVAWALSRCLDLHVPADRPLTLAASELSAYAGRYAGEFGEIDITVGQGCLVVTRHAGPDAAPPRPYSVAFYEPDKVFHLDGTDKDTRGGFVRDSRGDVAWFRPSIPEIYHRQRV